MPIRASSAPEFTVGSPRSYNDLIQALSSFLSAGINWFVPASNGPAITGHSATAAPAATRLLTRRKSRRVKLDAQPQSGWRHDGFSGWMDMPEIYHNAGHVSSCFPGGKSILRQDGICHKHSAEAWQGWMFPREFASSNFGLLTPASGWATRARACQWPGTGRWLWPARWE